MPVYNSAAINCAYVTIWRNLLKIYFMLLEIVKIPHQKKKEKKKEVPFYCFI